MTEAPKRVVITLVGGVVPVPADFEHLGILSATDCDRQRVAALTRVQPDGGIIIYSAHHAGHSRVALHEVASETATSTANARRRPSWYEVAPFFLSKDRREELRGDLGEIRLEMRQRGHGWLAIELATATQIVRSFFGSWSVAIGGVATDGLKEVVRALVKIFFGS